LKYFSLWRKFLKAVLVSASLFFLALALSRPQWGEVSQQVAQEGRDVLIALDVSRSMLAQDIKPSRIEVAKRKIKELLAQLPAERVSLLLFSGIALVQCPFTHDTQAFLNFLDIADVEATSSGTTALDAALSESIKAFKTVPGRSSRIMVVCTDGEDFSTNLAGIEAEARKEGVHIFTLGIGTTEGAPIPLYDDEGHMQGHQKDAEGNVVITRLNEQLLDELSKKTGGSYIPISSDSKDISTLVQLVHRFEKQKFDATTIAVKEEHYALFALMSALLLLGEWIL
jgi:Ca-activated chloride channel family protein